MARHAVKIRQPGRPGQDAPGGPAGVATDGGIERATAGRGQGLAEPALAWIVTGRAGRRPAPRRRASRARPTREGTASAPTT